MQKKCAPALLIPRFHACMAGIPAAGAPPFVGGSGRDPWLIAAKRGEVGILCLLSCLAAMRAPAQQKPAQQAETASPTLTVQSTLVLAPVPVKTRAGHQASGAYRWAASCGVRAGGASWNAHHPGAGGASRAASSAVAGAKHRAERSASPAPELRPAPARRHGAHDGPRRAGRRLVAHRGRRSAAGAGGVSRAGYAQKPPAPGARAWSSRRAACPLRGG
jgi:hypothetical protein